MSVDEDGGDLFEELVNGIEGLSDFGEDTDRSEDFEDINHEEDGSGCGDGLEGGRGKGCNGDRMNQSRLVDLPIHRGQSQGFESKEVYKASSGLPSYFNKTDDSFTKPPSSLSNVLSPQEGGASNFYNIRDSRDRYMASGVSNMTPYLGIKQHSLGDQEQTKNSLTAEAFDVARFGKVVPVEATSTSTLYSPIRSVPSFFVDTSASAPLPQMSSNPSRIKNTKTAKASRSSARLTFAPQNAQNEALDAQRDTQKSVVSESANSLSRASVQFLQATRFEVKGQSDVEVGSEGEGVAIPDNVDEEELRRAGTATIHSGSDSDSSERGAPRVSNMSVRSVTRRGSQPKLSPPHEDKNTELRDSPSAVSDSPDHHGIGLGAREAMKSKEYLHRHHSSDDDCSDDSEVDDTYAQRPERYSPLPQPPYTLSALPSTLPPMPANGQSDPENFLAESALRDYLMRPCVAHDPPLLCRIERHRSGLNRMTPLYKLYYERGVQHSCFRESLSMSYGYYSPGRNNPNASTAAAATMGGSQFLMAAKKRAMGRTSYHLVSLSESVEDRNSDSVLGKIRGNAVGSQYVLLNGGMAPQARAFQHDRAERRRELGVIQFQYPESGPSRLIATLPEVSEQGHRILERSAAREVGREQRREGQGQEWVGTGPDTWRDANRFGGHPTMTLVNVKPKWDSVHGGHVLNFRGRVTVSSVKNFQMVLGEGGVLETEFESVPTIATKDPKRRVVLQFGRTSTNSFSMDVSWPLSPFQAFAICVASLDRKIADRTGYALVKRWAGGNSDEG